MKTTTQCPTARIAPDAKPLTLFYVSQILKYMPFYLAFLFLSFQTYAQMTNDENHNPMPNRPD
ncbi:hypothetical protein, partial [Muriicola sp.]|uniref:hypothetical protein n=1 Tax=Muriicola sp. TaxID=2020856 RepID=UPI003567EBFD